MSKKPPSLVQFNFTEDKPEEEIIEKVDEINHEDNDDSEKEEEELIKIEEKEKIVSNDIFEDIPVQEPEPEKPKPPAKQSVKQKKARKPMSEEHKKKLAIAREKAMKVRKEKAEEKKKMKALENEEKELLKKQKVKKVQKLKEEVEDNKIPADLIDPVKLSNALTKKDLEDAQLEAIMKYEAMRKERKAKKKEEQMIEEGKKKMLNQINRATNNYRYRDGSNRFDACY